MIVSDASAAKSLLSAAAVRPDKDVTAAEVSQAPVMLFIDQLTEAKLAQESQGALVVFHPEHPRFKTQPFIMRKADGASNYATTDLATALYRLEHFRADGIVVVTDFRQGDHFEQLFLTVKKWFAAKNYRLPELHHVTFGAVTGEDGKALKTRSGDVIKLKALLDEADGALQMTGFLVGRRADRVEATVRGGRSHLVLEFDH